MAFDATTFKQNFAAALKLPTAPKPSVVPPQNPVSSYLPSAQKLPAVSAPRVSQTTSPTPTGPGTTEIATGAVKLLNPLHAIQTRPAFARAGETEPLYGGGLIVGAHDIAARTLEAVPNILARTVANIGQALNHGKSTSITLPFDTSRIGIDNPNPAKLMGADLKPDEATALIADLKKSGKDAYIQDGQVYAKEPSNQVSDSGTNMMQKFDELQKSNPDQPSTNLALAVLAGPVSDALNAFVVGDLFTGAAKTVLSATKYSPELEWALQTYGIKNGTKTGEDFTQELTARFNKKAATLIKNGDTQGLNQLGRATNIILTKLTGKGVPQLNKVGQLLQDTARTALQDSKYGFHLQHPLYPELAPEAANVATGEAERLSGLREMPGQAPAMGMSTRRMERVGGAEEPKPFEGFKDLSIKTLDKLKGKTTVSKQYISDLTNSSDLKQPERDLLRDVLAHEGVQVNVQQFADKVRAELLPLDRTQAEDLGGKPTSRYENISLHPDVRGPVAHYSEHIYESPIKTSAGEVHFGDGGFGLDDEGSTKNYFGHTRVEDLPPVDGSQTETDVYKNTPYTDLKPALAKAGDTRRVIEVQSDLYQKGNLEKEGVKYAGKTNEEIRTLLKESNPSQTYSDEAITNFKKRGDEVAKLAQYSNPSAHFRMIREEVKQAAKDGKTKLQFPTGETAMKIEGLGGQNTLTTWITERPRRVSSAVDDVRDFKLTPENMSVGKTVQMAGNMDKWIITDVLGDGKFKAVPKNPPKRFLDEYGAEDSMFGDYAVPLNRKSAFKEALEEWKRTSAETFDISGKVDTENPIYKFYEKEVGKYLKNKYAAERITDPQGQSWWEVPINESHKNSPVDAFGLGLGVNQQEDENGRKKIGFNPAMAVLGLLGSRFLGPEFNGLSEAVLKEIAESTDAAAIKSILMANGVRAVAAHSLAKELVDAKAPSDVANTVFDVPREVVPTDEESLNIASQQQELWQPYLDVAQQEEAALVDNLTAVFADMKGLELEDVKTDLTSKDIEEARLHYSFLQDALLDHPGRALLKYVSPTTGELPEFTGKDTMQSLTGSGQTVATGEWARHGDDIFQDLVGQELSKGGDVVVAQKMVDDYKAMRSQMLEVQDNLRSIRKAVRLAKLKDTFVESSKRSLARETVKDITALRTMVEAAERAGFRKGIHAGNRKVATIIQRIRSRRHQVLALKKTYDLSNKQMRDVTKDKDWRLIRPDDFESWLKEVETRAMAEHHKDIQKQIIGALLDGLELKNPDNLRHAMELPAVSKMDMTQLQEYENALSRYQKGDSFLGPRMVTTLENTNLSGAKTYREIKEKLAEETGAPMSELADVRGSELDKFTYDQALMQENPLYRYMVSEFAAKDVENAQKLMHIQETINKLAKASRASRPVQQKGKLIAKLVPQDLEVFGWLNTVDEEQAAFADSRKMTQQELEYANFVKELYRGWRDLLIEKGTLKKWREAYVTHTARSFLERWLEDTREEGAFKGFIKSVLSSWRQFTDAHVDFPAVGDTGTVLGLEKFFKYSLPRGKEIIPSKNVAKVVMQYARTFYKKDALDQILPKVEAYTMALQRTPGPGIPRDPTGLNVDGQLKQFIKQWLNNKKGRKDQFFVQQGGKIDAGLRIMNFVMTMHDLGFNLIAQPTSVIGEIEANFIGMELPEFARGAKRLATKSGRAVAAKYPGVVGEPPFERLINAANDASDTFMAGAYYIFQEVSYRAKQQYFLGLLTPDELVSGEVSSARQAEIKNEMGKVRPIEGTESVRGSTTEGKLMTKYKTWAVPLLTTVYKDLKQVLKFYKQSERGEKATRDAAAKSARRLLRASVASIGTYLFFSYIFADEKKKTTLGYIEYKVLQELGSAYSTLDPRTWTKVRAYEFANKMATDVVQLLTLAKYTSNGPGYSKGDLKAPNAFANDLTPAVIRQFLPTPPQTITKPSSSSTATKNPALQRLEKLKKTSGAKSNPALDRLKKLKKANQNSNPALNRLKALKK